MTHVALPCGIHEGRRILDPCPACARAAVELELELAAMPTKNRVVAAAHEARIVRRKQETEELMQQASRYTAEQQADAVRRRCAGETSRELAKELGCSSSLIDLWVAKARKAGQAPVAEEKGAPRSPPEVDATPERQAVSYVDLATVDAPDLNALGALFGVPRSGRTHVAYLRAITEVAVRSMAELDALRAVPPSRPTAAARPRPYTVHDPSDVAHEDVIAFLAALPPMPWALGDAIRLLSYHALDGDADDVVQARERIDAHLRVRGEVARG